MDDIKIEFYFSIDSEDSLTKIEELTPQIILNEAFLYDGKPCCSFKGGFEISKNGKVWNSFEGSLFYDDLYMSFNFVKALVAVLKGDKNHSFFIYEESSALMKLVDKDTISIKDTAFGKTVFEETSFDLKDFSVKLLEKSRVLLSFINEIINEINSGENNCKTMELRNHLKSMGAYKMVNELENKMIEKGFI